MVGDLDRERTLSTLREAYACGRLTLDEFSHRSDRVLASRSHRELRAALAGLPLRWGSADLAGIGDSLARTVVRGAVLLALTGAYVVFTGTLVLALVLALVLHGATTPVLLTFLVVWVVPTYLIARLWRRVGLPRLGRSV